MTIFSKTLGGAWLLCPPPGYAYVLTYNLALAINFAAFCPQFLDAQRIHNLASYLETLHEKGLANEDHTTLLLNCFTKLKDVENLNKFIMASISALLRSVTTEQHAVAILFCFLISFCDNLNISCKLILARF